MQKNARELNVRKCVGQLSSLTIIYKQMVEGDVPSSEGTKKIVKESIKDICSAISEWANEFYSS